MAFITAESVKEKRNNLKKEFPKSKGWKFSVTRVNHSKIRVIILEAPLNLLRAEKKERGYEQIHANSISDFFNGEEEKALTKINKIVNEENYDNSDSMTDYFDIGFFTSISIGNYDKPFIHTKMELVEDI